jgi:hypothetical protein
VDTTTVMNLKTTLVLGILGVATSCAFSQLVDFNNANLSEPPDRTVYMPDMMTPVLLWHLNACNRFARASHQDTDQA